MARDYTDDLKTYPLQTSLTLTSTSNVTESIVFGKPVWLVIPECSAQVTTQTNSTADIVVGIYKTPSGGSALEIGTITIPTGQAAGVVKWGDGGSVGSENKIAEDDAVNFKVKTAASSAGVVVCKFGYR